MRLPSFKTKFVLLSVLLSGLVLAAFAVLAVAMIRRTGLERVDRELLALGDPQVRRMQPPEHWPHFDQSLRVLYGEDQPDQYVILVTDRRDQAVYASPRWPVAVDAATLVAAVPAPARALQPPRPPERPEFAPTLWRTHEGPDPRGPFSPGRGDFADNPPRPLPLHTATPLFVTRTADDRTWRFAVLGNEQVTLVVGTDLAGFQAEIRRFRNTCLVAAPAALLLLAIAGWLLAVQALRPVNVLTQVAGGITAAGLDQRVPVLHADREFRRLIDVINAMLARIERSYRQATRFSADAAHELKTPLTILQGQLEQAVQGAASGSREQRTYAELLEEAQRLKGIIRKLLLLAQADAGQLRLNMQRLDLSETVQAVADDIRTQAPDVKLEVDAAAGVAVAGDPDLLNQAIQNLASNAMKFNDERRLIRLTLRASAGQAVLSVANTGAGIPPDERERLFERFYRADKARNRHVDGAGLGLSLAREIARAHGGDLSLAASDARLTTFTLTLPLAPEAR